MKQMKTVTMKTEKPMRGKAKKVGKGHSFGSAGAGRNTLFISRKSRGNDKVRIQQGEF
jgi:hypothetical protein